MSTSSQAKEVILEIGTEISEQTYSTQVQSGAVSKQVLYTCAPSTSCYTGVVNTNSALTPFNGWHQMNITSIQQGGNSPSIYAGGVSPIFSVNTPGASLNYAFDQEYTSNANEANIILFEMETAGGGNPGFNGISYSVNSNTRPFVITNNILEDGRGDTEQGRMLYLKPKDPTEYNTNISFEILEGAEGKLLVRGAGGMSIGEYLNQSAFPAQTITELNSIGFFERFDAYISPYVHEGNWEYDASGKVTFDSSINTIHASYAPSQTNDVNFASIVREEGAFGIRSTGGLFNCEEYDTSGYTLDINITLLNNCTVKVLTYTDTDIDEYTTDEAGIIRNGTDWVFDEITTTGNKTICVPYHYNTIDTEESQNPHMAGLGGGWTTDVQVYTAGGEYSLGDLGQKRFYSYQYKFIKVEPIDESLPYSVKIEKFELKNAGYNMKSFKFPTFISRKIEVPTYKYDYLDIFDRNQVPLALTFNSGDLKDPSKRSTGYSKTFELPASNRNQRILKSLTGIGAQRQSSDISWRKARVSSNGIVVFNGFARIEQSVTSEGGKYTCHILQDPSYWPELISDKKLCDLTFANHIKSYANIVDSWTKSVDDIPYVYPAISYGEWSKDSNGNQQDHSISDFHPAVYAKAIVDRIFADIGYTIDSTFFNEAMFKKLIIPYTSGEDYSPNDEVGLGENGNLSSHASLAAELSLPGIPAVGGNFTTTRTFWPVIPCQNGCSPTGNYTPGSSQSLQNGYTVPFTGRFTVHYQAQVKMRFTGLFCADCQAEAYWTSWVHIDGLVPQGNGALVNISAANSFVSFPGGGVRNMTGTAKSTISTCDSGGDWTTMDFTAELDLIQGEKIQVGLYGRNIRDLCSVAASIKDQDFAVWPVIDQAYVAPSEVSISSSLGCGVKQIDFLKGLTEMFNLYWTADNDTKTISVEPYDNFYGSGKIVDWSKKIDRKGWTDKFLIEELAKSTTYKYKKDNSDKIVDAYNEQEDTELWSITQTNNELYRKKEMVLGTTVFSPTFRIYNGTDGDLTFVTSGQAPILPCMWANDENLAWGWFWGLSRPQNKTKFNMRILNWYGLSSEVGTWNLVDDAGVAQTHNTFPYAYTYDKHAGITSIENNLAWYNLGDTVSTYQRGLFDRFHGRLYEKISGGAALRTCMMDLTQTDISQFDFRNIIKINQDGETPTYWTVNKIIDYTPGKDELTKVELIEWKYGFYVDGDGNVVAYTSEPTNYGGIGNSGKLPSGGSAIVSGSGGKSITIQDNGVYYIEPKIALPSESNQLNVSNSVTTEILDSVPRLPNNTQQFTDKLIESNQYNGLRNNPAVDDALHNNTVIENGIALGIGLHASPNQTILGSFNNRNISDAFQVGSGYYNSRTGNYERVNSLSVSKNGDFSVFGGEVIAEFSTKDYSITGDVYYTDEAGIKRKVYLKNRIINRY